MAVTFTGLQLIKRSLQLVGAIAANETPEPDATNDSLAILNGLLDTFATQRLMMPATSRQVFTTIDNQSTYTVGPGGDFDTDRPSVIEYANVLAHTATPPFEIPMTPLDDQSYAALTIKEMTSAFPYQYYWNATNVATGSLFLWPTPTDSATYQIVLYVPTLLAQVDDITDSFTMRPGYYRMLYYNLAQELAPAFGIQTRPDIISFARMSLLDVQRLNLEMVDLDTSTSLPGGGGIYNGFADVNY